MDHAVLIVDDDIDTRTLLGRMLGAEGYDVSTAGNGADAVRRLIEAKPCVIVLDCEMPVMDGHDFREVQKAIVPDVPIICITGAPDGMKAASRVGASRVHFKPFDVAALCQTVAELCRVAHSHQHAAAVESCLERERSERPQTAPAPAAG
jgi:DNA-binding NtrC family response regulator